MIYIDLYDHMAVVYTDYTVITLTVNFTSQAMRKLCNLTNALVQHLEQLHFHLRVATLVTRRLVFVDAQSVALLIWRSWTWARPAPAKCLALLCYGRYRWWRVNASPLVKVEQVDDNIGTLEHLHGSSDSNPNRITSAPASKLVQWSCEETLINEYSHRNGKHPERPASHPAQHWGFLASLCWFMMVYAYVVIFLQLFLLILRHLLINCRADVASHMAVPGARIAVYICL